MSEDIPLKSIRLSDVKPRPRSMQWGRWTLHPHVMVLELTGREKWLTYEVCLDRIHNSSGCLDWIMQVQKKTWCTPVILFDLIRALDDIFKIQSRLCSFGRGSKIDPAREVNDYMTKNESERAKERPIRFERLPIRVTKTKPSPLN